MKHYTFEVVCSFTMQLSFTEQEVQTDADGNKGDVEPTYDALILREEELRTHIQQAFAGVSNVEVVADSDALLGVHDDTTDWG